MAIGASANFPYLVQTGRCWHLLVAQLPMVSKQSELHMLGQKNDQLRRMLGQTPKAMSLEAGGSICVSPSKLQVFEAAKSYLECGLSLIPISTKGNKKPAYELLARGWWPARNKYRWPRRYYERVMPTLKEIRAWFLESDPRKQFGIGIVSGRVSGGLEVLDFDNAERIEPWSNLVEQDAPGLLERLVCVQTPRPGIHLYYRCSTFERSQKLALVPNPENSNCRPGCEIETKGETGYVLAPFSPAQCHPSFRCYSFLGHQDFSTIPTITAEERRILLKHARCFNVWEKNKQGLFARARDLFHRK